MDKRVRLNDICIIGQPRCGYAFSSTRSCFIGYPFGQSNLEVSILSTVLEERGIDPVQAGDRLAAGQNAFCTKICSKIITSQFCAIFANNEVVGQGEVPNANVHLEYGMMLGFNKHVIPFQLEGQKLEFNVAGLDTVKYTPATFEEKATAAVEDAILVSRPETGPPPFDQLLEAFFLANGVLMATLDSEGDQILYSRGKPFGYWLLHDFTAWNYIYFGVFPQLTAQAIIWRLSKTSEVLTGIVTSVTLRVKMQFATAEQLQAAKEAVGRFSIWIVVSDEEVREEVEKWCSANRFAYPVRIFFDAEVRDQFERIASGAEFETQFRLTEDKDP